MTNYLQNLSDADRHQDTEVVIFLWAQHCTSVKEHLKFMQPSKLHNYLTSVISCVENLLVNVHDIEKYLVKVPMRRNTEVMSDYVHWCQRHIEGFLLKLCERKDVYLPNLVRYMACLNHKLGSFIEDGGLYYIIKTTDKGQPLCQETGE